MFGAIAGGIASALAGGAMSKLFGGGQKAASGGIQGDVLATDNNTVGKIGRASCRERVWISVVAVSLKKKKEKKANEKCQDSVYQMICLILSHSLTYLV